MLRLPNGNADLIEFLFPSEEDEFSENRGVYGHT